MASSQRLKAWIVAVPLGTGVNLALLALLSRAPYFEPPEASPPILITLERSRQQRALRPDRPASTAERRGATSPDVGVEAASAPPPTTSVAPAAPVQVAPEWLVDGGVWMDPQKRQNARRMFDLQDQLRIQRACSGKSGERLRSYEKDQCYKSWGDIARQAPAPPPVDLDPRGASAKEAEPYLQRKPKNGCKPRAGGAAGPLGQQGAAAGLGCAFSF